jgi:hypothetical protein
MNRTIGMTVDDYVATVSQVFHEIFERIDGWRVAVEDHVSNSGNALTRAGVDSLVEKIVVPEFSRQGSFTIGAGFVAAPGLIPDAPWHLAWWLGDLNTFGMGSGAPHVRRLEAVEDPAAESFRDYTTLEWWRVPYTTGHRHITGPYVDYLCTDEYTLTLTEPVYRGLDKIGVVGADLYVEDLESVLLPGLRAVGHSTTLVNSFARVVLSTDVHLATGALLRLDGLSDALRKSDPAPQQLASGHLVVGCADTGLALVVAH